MTAPNQLPEDYAERVYSGVLGKILGVYVGRPVEGWLYSKIQERVGDIEYYVHDKVGVPLIVVDDDISGTLAFLAAFRDNGYDVSLTSEQIGKAWLNYAIEERTIFWWGGMGNSTEHTAYLRMKNGIAAPRSGSIELNGPQVAEQIGSQIFIDGWAMLLPGQPDLAADLARRAAAVSHDGEAIYAAQVIAAMEAQAFVESDIDALLDTGLSVIPADSTTARLIRDLREWHSTEPDWRAARERLEAEYGYDKFGGNVHVVPNHGVIILALLYGEGDWGRSMMIVNTCGWDTDCNSGNLGCLLGIRNGLSGFDGRHDWRTPVADRLFLPTADGARTTTDAVTEALVITNIARRIRGEEPLALKDGAKFGFHFPGSVQGFEVVAGTAELTNTAELGRDGDRGLRIRVTTGAQVHVATPTFVPPEILNAPGYGLQGTPRLHSGQTVTAAVRAESADTTLRLAIQVYDEEDGVQTVTGPAQVATAGEWTDMTWVVADTGGYPIASVGLVVEGQVEGSADVVLDRMDWHGQPEVVLTRPVPPTWRPFPNPKGGTAWRRAWVDAMDMFGEGWGTGWPEPYRLIQNTGRGMVLHGSEDWRDIEVSAGFTPHMAVATGLAIRTQGLRRHYSLVMRNSGIISLVKSVDGDERVLGEAPFRFELYREVQLRLKALGATISAFADGTALFEVTDVAPLEYGGIALLCEEGRVAVGPVTVRPSTTAEVR
ncbi:ADP-ribosylglycohydrolase family protein [Pseudolysinimonas yzui]|uniref:ADP-ribosylglycohydrolase family protein n=1 Tax=Pseudolysinimonas yzui TaxID=2708254 RepID=A0A8J3M2S5_9MICO|nr:ADP-ribosylglycohydrolase family protein [Pseudolysinimonas yzui]GHF26532.1 hypothetical protein GCM10011600_29390 [Pseudolysinimonas yzui]